MRPTAPALIVATALLALPASAPAVPSAPPVAQASAECRASYVLTTRGISCAKARRHVRRLRRGGRAPRGWRCNSGSDFRSGGICVRGRRFFAWHPGD